MADYFPRPDGEFNAWQRNFNDYVNANLPALGLSGPDVAQLNAARGEWDATLAAHTSAHAAAGAARQSKDAARAALTAATRTLVARLQSSPQVDDPERRSMGLTVRDTVRTPSPLPVTRPRVRVETPARLRHVLHFADESSFTRSGKPPGVRGVQIWVKLVQPQNGLAQPPAGPSELSFVAAATRTPYALDFGGGDANKVAHYMLRWENTRGETGPWSETASATIGA